MQQNEVTDTQDKRQTGQQTDRLTDASKVIPVYTYMYVQIWLSYTLDKFTTHTRDCPPPFCWKNDICFL